MVEKIIVNPLNVRGHGNIVSSKTVEDFTTYNSSLSFEDSFYTMEFTESAITISLVVSSGTVSVGEAVTCTATVLDNGVAVPNVSVRFFDGNSVLGTVESDSNGEAVLSVSTLSAGSHSIVASYGGQSSSAVSVTVNKLTTSISLSSNKASCYIDETFTLSGTLSRGEGYNVYLYNGTVLVDTLTTGTDGAFSKVITPSGTGSFNYSVKYNGDSSYDEATSSVVAVSVVKRTPSISISKSGDVTVGTAFTISGTLSCTGSVKLYENGSLLDTLTVTGGAFSETLTKSVTGSYSYYVVFDGDSTYESVTSSTVTVTVSAIAPDYDDIVLTADDSILSYSDGDSITLRAQLMDGTSTASVSGVTVEFFNGSTSLGTAQTDSNGVATKTYTSTGAGDISLTASDGTLSSETCGLTDARYYNDGSRVTGMQGTSGASITTDGEYVSLTATNSGEKQIGYGITYTSSDNWEISCIIDYANSVGHAYSFVLSSSSSLGGSNNYLSLDILSSSFYVKLDGGSARTYQRTFATGDKITIRRLNGDWILLHNDDEVWKGSYSWSGNRMICHYVTSARTIKIKDIVIKPL